MSEEIRDQFRQAMRRMAATVTVITIRRGGANAGMTASAVTSLCMAPPSLLVCVNKAAAFHEAISSAEYFCVNVLRHGQEDISSAFAGKLTAEQRFSVGSWGQEKLAPYLLDSQAAIFCRRTNLFAHGTHSIIVGQAVELILGHPIMPLIYADGQYSTVA
ncbi:MAG: flavin reductase family protein [Azospirillaceae bacterium]|nr:flavin reductase family protein [Azospirillaceae bacterium]